jgi:hypothetical protein
MLIGEEFKRWLLGRFRKFKLKKTKTKVKIAELKLHRKKRYIMTRYYVINKGGKSFETS